jgi:two-component system LytT family sensor kinase
VGPLGGSIISLPAFVHHEWLSMPVAATAGLVGGLIRQAVPNTEEIWRLGPYTFLSTPRWLVRLLRGRKVTWEMLPLSAIIVLELARQALCHATKLRWLFYLDAGKSWGIALILLSTVMAVAVPMKIWNNTRTEMNLEQHQQLLLKARMDALTAQINPHFLFNTLNTVSSLIRYDPDTARGVVIKLSNILRRLLRKHETFVPLQEELDFIDDYLDIEVARFGRDNLVIQKQIDDKTLDAFVPSMLLQPIVENALKHGLAGKLGGGELTIRTESRDGRVVIAIEDNGVGIPKERMAQVFEDGIGISNVHERLRVLYGADFRMDISSQEGQGTRICIDIPELMPSAPEPSIVLPVSKV